MNVVAPPAWISDNALVAHPNSGRADLRYLAYVIESLDLPADASHTAQPLITQSSVRDRVVPLVPLREQVAIADFLDAETARIDALITKKRRLIELLDTRRRSLIEQVLCDDRPAHDLLEPGSLRLRGAVAMKRLLDKTIAGGTPTSDDESYWTDPDDPSGHIWIAIGDMVDRGRTVSSSRALTSAGLSACRLRPSRPGTLLFAMYASLGKTTVTAAPAVWNQAIIGLVPNTSVADARYLAYWLETIRPHLASMARSSTQDNLNAEQVGELPVPVTTLPRQIAAVDYLDAGLAGSAEVAARLVHQIDLLVEHRQALITAAVTGELAVPGVAA